MGTCSLDDCNNKCFEEEDKCILHCEKNDWYEIENSFLGENQKNWYKSKDKIDKFFNAFYEELKMLYAKDINITNVHFPIEAIDPFRLSIVIEKLELEVINFFECKFYDRTSITSYNKKNLTFKELNIVNTLVEGELYLSNINIENISIHDNEIPSIRIEFSFLKEVKIFGNLHNKKQINNINIIGSEINSFFQIKDVDLETLILNNTTISRAVLENINISDKLNLEYTIFKERLDFFDVVYEKTIDLAKTSLSDNTNFLGLSSIKNEKTDIKVSNRETARKIKHSFEKQNNIIEANKFYALEMNEREKELSKDKKSNFSDWFIFKLHKTSSYYSQSWSRALFWIVLLSVLYTFEQNGIPTMTLFLYFFIITMSLLYFTKKSTIATNIIEKLGSIIFSLMLIYFADYEIFKAIIIVSFDNGYIINETIKNIYPLSNLSIDKMTASIFIYKIVISYLIYQFIVSVRQNTRRK